VPGPVHEQALEYVPHTGARASAAFSRVSRCALFPLVRFRPPHPEVHWSNP
jgi:hypothetical protein